ncbi:MAG: hypothetical protein JW891_02125 [Candidatus Lokiarchaeota archaeon]|nr:hypothetical protein [Candidatus Lokiarchaeota archaeon]
MDVIKGIEGDYLETKEHLFFDVKGLLHPPDRKICFVRFYPDPSGDRVKDGVKYKKIYNLEERTNFLKKNHPKYVFFSDQLGLELQGVKNDDILKIYTPRDYYAELKKKNNLSRLEKCSIELCELFVSEGEIPRGSIGISGSPMVGLNKDQSDIDLVVYGTKESLRFQSNLREILSSQENFCRPYNEQEYQVHYDWRVGGSKIPYDKFLACESRKLHQGMYKGFEFFVRYIKTPEDWGGTYDDYKYIDCGRVKLKAKILDSTDSIFTPCSYHIKPLELLEGALDLHPFNLGDLREVNSFRGRFCEHAIENELVIIEGKLEKVIFKNIQEYYRILLTDQTFDMMIRI